MLGKQAFDDWKADAKAMSLLQAASMAGAKLKRAGSEHVGPCPMCGGRDRFSVNPSKGVWNCRGAEGGQDSIGLVMHTMGVDFKAACELLTGTPPPNGQRGQIDPEARQRAAQRREKAERDRQRQEEIAAQSASEKRHRARVYWDNRVVKNSSPYIYLQKRGIEDALTIPALGAHPEVYHEIDKHTGPALLGCVVGPDKSFKGVWRIFVDSYGEKAKVSNVKMGLGKPEGGSVWIASRDQMQDEIWGICEGIETALSIRELFHNLPVFAALSTSGMVGFQIPEHIKHLVIYPDGDIPTQNPKGGWNEPPGMSAARRLSERLREAGFSHEIVQPPEDGDWNDVLRDTKEKGFV